MISDHLRAMAVKVSVNGGKICNETTMGKMLESFGDAGIVNEINGSGLDFVQKAENGLSSTSQ